MSNKQKQQQPPDIQLLGKIPPQAREFEEAVLGALLIEPKSYQQIEGILREADFYDNSHATIFKAITNLYDKRKPVDMLTVVQELQRMGEIENAGGAYHIAELSGKIASAAHIEYHARIISQKAVARRIIEESSRIQAMAYDETKDVDEVLEIFEKSLSLVQPDNVNMQSVSMAKALKQAIDEASTIQAQRSEGVSHDIPTPLKNLTKSLNGGFRKPDLIIIGARPSMGKTQVALQIAKAAAEAGKNICFISIEMTLVQLINRYLLEDDRIRTDNLLSGQMNSFEWQAVDEQASRLYDLPIWFADHHSIRYLSNIKTEARRLKRLNKLDMLIVDYLGLIRTNMKFERKQIELGYITGELKSLAKELGIPIIALSQLSRPEKGAKVRVPRLDDLRESGDIEQDADVVMFIHKPEYYEPELTDWRNKGMIVIGKYRNGARNSIVTFGHDERYKKIFDTEDTPSMGNIPF